MTPEARDPVLVNDVTLEHESKLWTIPDELKKRISDLEGSRLNGDALFQCVLALPDACEIDLPLKVHAIVDRVRDGGGIYVRLQVMDQHEPKRLTDVAAARLKLDGKWMLYSTLGDRKRKAVLSDLSEFKTILDRSSSLPGETPFEVEVQFYFNYLLD